MVAEASHHFGHARIIELEDRPFANVEEMDRVMVERWNDLVAPDDVVYHLGDLAMGTFDDSITLAGQLHGRKFLIPGNHDRVFSVIRPARRERFYSAYEAAGFAVLPEQVEFDLDGTRVLLCHFPPAGDSHGADRYASLRPTTELPVIHGHTHGADPGGSAVVHVGVDARNFAPVSGATVLAQILESGKGA